MSHEIVFLLCHVHHLPDGEDDDKLLGVYASREEATTKIETLYKTLPGFRDVDGEFIVDEYRIGEDNWTEGFVTTSPSKKTKR